MKKYIKIGLGMGIGILAVFVIFMSVFNFVKTFNGEWVCIAENCDEWLTGDDWISANCRPQDVSGEEKLVCKLMVNENEYTAPLDIINMSSVKSCKSYSCTTEVLIKQSIPKGGGK